jgi:ABC-type antimicrobial peptide transport system permease subunit
MPGDFSPDGSLIVFSTYQSGRLWVTKENELMLRIAWRGGPLSRSLLLQVPPNDVPTFVGAGLLFAVVAALACLVPASRATRVDPAISLWTE